MNTATWLWPQWTMIVMSIMALIGCTVNHGKDRPPYNGFVALVNFGLCIWILAEGGFFS